MSIATLIPRECKERYTPNNALYELKEESNPQFFKEIIFEEKDLMDLNKSVEDIKKELDNSNKNTQNQNKKEIKSTKFGGICKLLY